MKFELCPNFFFLIRGGGRGSEQIRTFTLFILFFFKASLTVCRQNHDDSQLGDPLLYSLFSEQKKNSDT